MAPQLWRRQLDAGAWGITAATVAQARVMLAAGVRARADRERGDRPARRRDGSRHSCATPASRSSAPWIRAHGVELLAEGIDGVPRPLPVLVELGHPGGRTGCRTVDDALDVARLVATKPALALAGATGFEGTICDDRTPACLDEVRAFLDRLAALTVRLRTDGLVETDGAWVSAGGSAFFDLVVERLGPPGGVADRRAPPLRPLRRPTTRARTNGYRRSPDHDPERRFHAAIEAWGAVLSRPEPDLAIVELRAARRSVRPGPADAVHAAAPLR